MPENQKSQLKAVYSGGTYSRDMYRHVLDISGAEKPKVTIAATPKQTKETFDEYTTKISGLFGELGADVQLLHQYGEEPNSEILEWADVLNVSGGNTERMMHIWETSGIAQKVKIAAYAGRLAMCGGSAGAIVGFTSGFSDSKSYVTEEGKPWDYIYVPGLDLIENTIITPHYDQPDKSRLNHEGGRKGAFIDSIAPNSTATHLGLDNAAALSVNDGKMSIFRMKPEADVYDIRKHDDGSTSSTPFRN